MPRYLWWAPVGLLILGMALVGLRWGRMAATVTETDVINHYAAQYVAEGPESARLTDCVAVPGTIDPVWIVVRCGEGAEARHFPVDRRGRLVVFAPREVPET